MTKRTKGIVLAGLCGLLCVGLCGCDARIDSEVINTQADYSIDIALPYATVTPPPAQQASEQALVINEEGTVIVNDSELLMSQGGEREAAEGNYKSLRRGNTGIAVQALQMRLSELGYLSTITGLYDTDTETAVRKFEQSFGTMQTGVATAELQQRLFAADAPIYGSDNYNAAVIAQYKELQRGDVGIQVSSMQQRLRNLGYPLDNSTGIFDEQTANAVRLFYEAYGLPASEVANVALQRELYADSARSYAGSGQKEVTASDTLNQLSQERTREAQQLLTALGYLKEGGEPSEEDIKLAIKLFEEASGRLPSGVISDEVLERLRSPNAARYETISNAYTNLIEGSGGEEVLRLQRRLIELGFAAGEPTGDYHAPTTQSVKLFQKANGLEDSGIADVQTQAVLYASFAINIEGKPAFTYAREEEKTEDVEPQPSAQPLLDERLTIGSTGDGVLRMQQRLTELGFVSAVTGIYDNSTSRAVSAFQATIGREPDGVASESLLQLLHSQMAPRNGQRLHDTVQPFRGLGIGDEGDDVFNLQRRLWEMGYLTKESIADSVSSFNDATGEAVRAAQEAAGFPSPDSYASPEFQCLIFAEVKDAFTSDN